MLWRLGIWAGAVLPDTFDAVEIERLVTTHDRYPFAEGLCDEEAIERIAVVKWQGPHHRRVRQLDGEQVELIESQLVCQVRSQWLLDEQLPRTDP